MRKEEECAAKEGGGGVSLELGACRYAWTEVCFPSQQIAERSPLENISWVKLSI